MTKRILVPMLCVCLLPVSVAAQSLRTTMAPAAAQQSAADWQKEVDAAEARKASGKRKFYYGLGGSAAGLLLALVGTGSCASAAIDGESCSAGSLRSVGWLLNLAGDGVFVWGLLEANSAKDDLERLERQRPTRKDLAVFALSDHHEIAVGAGTKKSLTYRINW